MWLGSFSHYTTNHAMLAPPIGYNLRRGGSRSCQKKSLQWLGSRDHEWPECGQYQANLFWERRRRFRDYFKKTGTNMNCKCTDCNARHLGRRTLTRHCKQSNGSETTHPPIKGKSYSNSNDFIARWDYWRLERRRLSTRGDTTMTVVTLLLPSKASPCQPPKNFQLG